MDFTTTLNPRPQVTVTEVGTRDGFQSEPTFIPTEEPAAPPGTDATGAPKEGAPATSDPLQQMLDQQKQDEDKAAKELQDAFKK